MALPALRIVASKLAGPRDNGLAQSAPDLARLMTEIDLSPSDSLEKKPTKSGVPPPLSSTSPAAAAETAALVSRVRTQLPALITDQQSPFGVWTGIILIHAHVSTRAWSAVEHSAPWIRALSTVLSRPGPCCVHVAAVTTLATIFRLSAGHVQFIREAVTPTLPSFIRFCFRALDSPARPDLVAAVIAALIGIVPNHPTVLRPFCADLQSALRKIVFSTDRLTISLSQSTRRSAAILLAELSRCAPRSGAGDEWARNVDEIINTAHRTLDRLLRALPFDCELTSSEGNSSQSDSSGPSDSAADSPFPAWSGLAAGTATVVRLLDLLDGFMSSSTSGSVSIPLGAINSLLSRILDLHAPSQAELRSFGVDRNSDRAVSRAELAELVTVHLPTLHAAALSSAAQLASRLGAAASAVLVHLLGSVPSLFQDLPSPSVRAASYRFVAAIISAFGPAVSFSTTTSVGLSGASLSSLTPVVKACCADLVDYYTAASAGASSRPAFPSRSLVRSASAVLPSLYVIPAWSLPASIRSLLDRTTVLLQHEPAFLASALFPSLPAGLASSSGADPAGRSAAPAILSMAPRRPHGFSLPLDGLIHPRFPAVKAPVQASLALAHDVPEQDKGCLNEDNSTSARKRGVIGFQGSDPSDVSSGSDTRTKRARISHVTSSLQSLMSDLESLQRSLGSDAVLSESDSEAEPASRLEANSVSSDSDGAGPSVSDRCPLPATKPSDNVLSASLLFSTPAICAKPSPQQEQSATLDDDVDMDTTDLVRAACRPAATVVAVENTDIESDDDADTDDEIPTLIMDPADSE